MKLLTTTALVMGLLISTQFAEARTIRATEMSGSKWAQLTQGKLQDLVVEFREGDELPMTFVAEGDLIATTHSPITYVTIKRSFWLKAGHNTLDMSLDGNTFKPFNQVITGQAGIGALPDQEGGPATSIQATFKAFLKN